MLPRRRHDGGRLARVHLPGERRARQHGDRGLLRKHVGQHTRRRGESLRVEALGHAHHQRAATDLAARPGHDLAHRMGWGRRHDDLGPTHRGREVTVGGKAGSECRARQEHVVQVLPIHALHHFGFTGPKRDGGEVPLTGEQVGERGAPRPSAHHGDLHPALPPDPISLTQPGPFSCETDSPSPPASARCCADACRRSAAPGPRPPRTYRAVRGP